jgi:hypothetical protein
MIALNKYKTRADLSQSLRSQLLWPNWRGKWVLGRHACLGNDVINLTLNKIQIFNIQKGRVDYLVTAIEDNNKRALTDKIAPYLTNKEIIPFIRQQEYCTSMPKHAPSFVYMDNFSELVDQLYIHRAGQWGGCCCYGDINHNDEFKIMFEEKGLLDIDHLESCYVSFFELIRFKYGDVPILFLHFPLELEKRTKYLDRGIAIFKVINKLAEINNNIHSISIDGSIVSKPKNASKELINFPYHYNHETYVEFAKKLNKILIEMKLNS